MELGFLNACLMDWPPARVVDLAARKGFSVIELHGGPRYKAARWPEVAKGDKEAVSAIAGPLEAKGVRCSGVMFGNLPYLDPDPDRRAEASRYLIMLLHAANQLGVPVVSTFAGRSLEHDLEGNIKLFAEVFAPLADEAERAGVRLAFENCAMTKGFMPATNIAYSPAIWEAMFDALPAPCLGLNLDPSHLQWMGADVVAATEEFGPRVVHVQAKDAEVMPSRLARTTTLGEDWWRYRIPGYGQVPWAGFFSALHAAGYAGAVSIEHEDPVFSGSDEAVVDGLDRAAAFLRPYL